ncbi:MAG: V-type ATPase subunit subunit G family protein [Nitrososphaerota archaeon]
MEGEGSELEKVVHRLSEVESELDKLVAEAGRAGRELVLTAEKEAVNLKAKLLAEMQSVQERLLAETSAEAEARAREIMEKAEREAAEVRARAERRVDEAVRLAVSALLGER